MEESEQHEHDLTSGFMEQTVKCLQKVEFLDTNCNYQPSKHLQERKLRVEVSKELKLCLNNFAHYQVSQTLKDSTDLKLFAKQNQKLQIKCYTNRSFVCLRGTLLSISKDSEADLAEICRFLEQLFALPRQEPEPKPPTSKPLSLLKSHAEKISSKMEMFSQMVKKLSSSQPSSNAMLPTPVAKSLQPIQRQTFVNLTIDRCFNAINKLEEPAVYMMYCLRYRTHLSINDAPVAIKTEGRGRNARAKTLDPSKPLISLYDTLLTLLQGYDVAGRVEICRLLLERRSPIPLVLPSGEHHLSLLRLLSKNLDSATRISLGEDATLMRVAIVSCRGKQQSQTTEILKEVFKVESLHREDFSKRSLTTSAAAVEIGLGCVTESTAQHFLVVHVVGDFEPYWNFLMEFSDYLIVEDSPVEEKAFLRSQVALKENSSGKRLGNMSVVVWLPSTNELSDEAVDSGEFPYYSIESAIGTQLYNCLAADVVTEEKRWKKNRDPKKFKKLLCEMKLPEVSSVECSVRFVDHVVEQVTDFGTLREKTFVLQKNFAEQAQFEEKKAQFRNEESKIVALDREIKKLKQLRQSAAPAIATQTLVVLLKRILECPDANVRILGTVQLEKALSRRCDALLPSLRRIIEQLSAELADHLHKNGNDLAVPKIQENLRAAKKKYNDTTVSSEHIWREISHIYCANHKKYKSYPSLAAQHLIDGMCIELLDGDANIINISWIEATMKEVDKRLAKNGRSPRIFVLSIMGMQSSGKSTLLNIMFGIQMKTSVGQCTRGINMQLIPVVNRTEYDYILLLDTEGTRAPEYWGLPGSEKRDNQMATMSILLADATIIVNSGENDAAIKEILPIVLLAYQGSELAEEKGGQMSSMLFFVYNRIDTREKDKLSNILQVLGTSLHEAFKTAYQLSGATPETSSGASANSSRLFQRFRLDSSNSKDSDVRILGNIKKGFTPPDDVPDPAYGEALAEFRQHIHDRVTGSPQWKSRTLLEFLTYMNLVWKCILSSDFNLNFKNVLERATYDQMNVEIKRCERQLSEEYKSKYCEIETNILISRTNSQKTDDIDIEQFKLQLADQVQTTAAKLDDEMKEILTKLGRDKWEVNSLESWKSFKKEQENQWKAYLEKFINYQLKFDHWADLLKKEMRKRIRNEFQDVNSRNKTAEEKAKLFKTLYDKLLEKAQDTQPSVNVEERVNEVYRRNPTIQRLPTEVFDKDAEFDAIEIIEEIEKASQSGSAPKQGRNGFSFFSSAAEVFQNVFAFKRRISDPTLTAFYQELFTQIIGWLSDKTCYVDSIVDEVINITQTVVIQKQFLHNKQLKKAHVFAKMLTVRNMSDIQNDWEKKNSVHAKLNCEECRKEMKTYFDEASQGVVDTQLFVVMLKSNLEKILAEAFEEEMILLTIGKISSKNWLLDPKALLSFMDLELLELIDQNELGAVLDRIRNSQKFYEEVLLLLISKERPNLSAEWQMFSDRVKRAINVAAAASSEVDSARAKRFIMELQHQGFQSGFRDNFLAKRFTTDSDGYDGCDNEEAEVFRQQLSDLTRVIDHVKCPILAKSCSNLPDKVMIRLREERAEEGVRPRCNVPCPLCKSLCILPFGHGATKKHTTFHQPVALRGGSWIETADPRIAGSLVPHTCSTAGGARFWRNDKWNRYKDFGVVFPDWLQPTFMEHLPLREYIFATYNVQIADYYEKKPCVDIPAEYHHNLENIRVALKEKTDSGSETSSENDD